MIIPISGYFNAMMETRQLELPQLIDTAVEKTEKDLTATIIKKKSQGRVQ